MSRHRDLPDSLDGDGDKQTKVKNNGDFFTPITKKERIEVTIAVRRRHAKFLQILVSFFGKEPFRRYDLDAGRLGYLINREVKYAGVGSPNPSSPNQLLQLDYSEIEEQFPEVKLL